MNNKTKGWIAAGLGGALLLGTGGTFALWSVDDEVAGGTVTTGGMEIEIVGDEIDWEVGYLAPGEDALTGTVDVNVELLGKGLEANLTVGSVEVPDGWEGLLIVDAAVDDNGPFSTEDGKETHTETVTLTVTASLAASVGEADIEDETMNEGLDLGDITVTLKQTEPTP